MKKKSVEKIYIFLVFAQNIDCWYTLDPLVEAVLTSAHNLCFGSKIRKIGIPHLNPRFSVQKLGLRGYTFHGQESNRPRYLICFASEHWYGIDILFEFMA